MLLNILLLTSAFLSTAWSAVTAARRDSGTLSPFKLYAYNNKDISGHEVVFHKGLAYAVKDPSSSDSNTVRVTFNLTHNGEELADIWTCTPDKITDQSLFRTATLYVPATGNQPANVSFYVPQVESQSEMSSPLLSAAVVKWRFYGLDVMNQDLETPFYAKSTGIEGVLALQWTATSDDKTAMPVSIRKTLPSSEP